MSAHMNMNGEQFSGALEWHQTALDPQGPLRSNLRVDDTVRSVKRDQRSAQGRTENYCAGCGYHQPVNPATFKCPTCTDRDHASMAARI